MPTTLTPAALREIEDLLSSSRRALSDLYREWRVGVTVQAMAEARGHEDLKKVKDSLSALRVLFGREPLPKRGKGRQQAIYEAQFWLNSDSYLSPEVQEHFEHILLKAEKTNTRRDGYEPPAIPRRSVYQQARDSTIEGEEAGIYVITKKSYQESARLYGRPPLVKIGWSHNVWDRISSAQTFEADPIVVLAIYLAPNPNMLEAKIHICLDTLGLSYDGGGGKEWFIASEALIDQLAQALGLENGLQRDSED